MFSRIYDALDSASVLCFGTATVSVATIDYNKLVSLIAGIIAILIGLGKIFEMVTGKKVASLFKPKSKR